MKTTFYFVRHGDVFNPEHILYNRTPYYHLSEKGIEQAHEAAAKLKDKKIDVLFASPLLRARQTATIIKNTLKLKHISYSLYLLEVKNHFAGEPLLERHKMNYRMYESPERKKSDETLEQIADRMLFFIQRTVGQHPGQTICVVTHGDPIMILRAALLQIPLTIDLFDKPYISTGSIMKMTIEDSGEITADLL